MAMETLVEAETFETLVGGRMFAIGILEAAQSIVEEQNRKLSKEINRLSDAGAVFNISGLPTEIRYEDLDARGKIAGLEIISGLQSHNSDGSFGTPTEPMEFVNRRVTANTRFESFGAPELRITEAGHEEATTRRVFVVPFDNISHLAIADIAPSDPAQ